MLAHPIVEIKNEFTEYLLNILTIPLYDGFNSIYKKSIELSSIYDNKIKSGLSITNPGINNLFKIFLKDIPNLNRDRIERETIRIKNSGKHIDFFDDLIKVVIKSYIILLTSINEQNYNLLKNIKHYDNVDTCNFIHKCYIEISKNLMNVPDIFNESNNPPSKIKENYTECIELIKKGILNAIRNVIPMKDIITEYLKNDQKKILISEIKNKISNFNKKIIDSSESIDNQIENINDPPPSSRGEAIARENGQDIANNIIVEKINNDEIINNIKEEIKEPLTEPIQCKYVENILDKPVRRRIKKIVNKITD